MLIGGIAVDDGPLLPFTNSAKFCGRSPHCCRSLLRGKTVTFWTASTLEVFEHPSSLGKSDVDQDAGSGSARHSFSNLGPAHIQKLCYQIRLLHSPCQGNGDLELANLLHERARDDSIAFNRQIPGRGGKPTRVKPNPFPT